MRFNGMRLRTRPWLPARPWLGAQRVHIRPSRAGLAFAALLLALWIAAVNYHLGLGYALTYFAAACAIADMLFASRNLAGLSLAATPGQPVFAGSQAFFHLRLINRSPRSRHAIQLAAADAAAPTAPRLADIAAHGETAVEIGVAARQRGWLDAPAVRLSSGFPLGLFYAWCHWQPEARVLVYPQPEQGAPPLPAAGGLANPARQAGAPDGALELAGVRAYQPGDPLQRLAWRQIARHDGEQIFSKHFQSAADARTGTAPGQLMLDLATLHALAPEARLSRLAAWVLAAERTSLPYGLLLGPLTLAPTLGASHRDACLRALALHALPQDPATAQAATKAAARTSVQTSAQTTAQTAAQATVQTAAQATAGTTAQPAVQVQAPVTFPAPAPAPAQATMQATVLETAPATAQTMAAHTTHIAPPLQAARDAPVAEPAPAVQPAQVARPAHMTQPTQETQPAQVTQPKQEEQPKQKAEPAQASRPAHMTQPTQETQPAHVTQPKQEAEPAQAAQPARPTQARQAAP